MNVTEHDVVKLTPPSKSRGWLQKVVSPQTANKIRAITPTKTPTCEWRTGTHQCPATATVKHETNETRYFCSIHAFETEWGNIPNQHENNNITMLGEATEPPKDKTEYTTDWVQCPESEKIHPAIDTVSIISDLHQNHGYEVEDAIKKVETEFNVSFIY